MSRGETLPGEGGGEKRGEWIARLRKKAFYRWWTEMTEKRNAPAARRRSPAMGDPGGIGPEVVLKALLRSRCAAPAAPVVVGDLAVLRQCARLLRKRPGLSPCTGDPGDPARGGRDPRHPEPCASIRRHRWSAVRRDRGAASIVRAARGRPGARGRADGVVTAPICKEAIHRAGTASRGTPIFWRTSPGRGGAP